MRARLRAPVALVALACAACASSSADTRYFDCERGGPLEVILRGYTATLVFDGRRYVLPPVEATRGERWARDDVLLWIRDGEASVTVGDQVLAWGCRLR